MNPHTDWCAGGHRCAMGEHRAEPISLTVPGAGSFVLTRVLATTGRQHAEIRLSVILADHEPHARARLVALLTHLRTLIGPPRAADTPSHQSKGHRRERQLPAHRA